MPRIGFKNFDFSRVNPIIWPGFRARIANLASTPGRPTTPDFVSFYNDGVEREICNDGVEHFKRGVVVTVSWFPGRTPDNEFSIANEITNLLVSAGQADGCLIQFADEDPTRMYHGNRRIEEPV